MSQYYRTNHLLLMLGATANFEKSEYYYQQLEHAIRFFNADNENIELTLSTLSLYGE